MTKEAEEKKYLIRISNKEYFEEWFDIVKKYLLDEEFQRRKKFLHHRYSVFDHAVNVSFKAFIFAKKHNIDARMCAICGLLHDFYPYTWRYSKELDYYNKDYNKRVVNKEFKQKIHGFVHGKEASQNIVKYYPELDNKTIRDAVSHHMFPMTLPPLTKVGWVITYIDKIDSIVDILNFNNKKHS